MDPRLITTLELDHDCDSDGMAIQEDLHLSGHR